MVRGVGRKEENRRMWGYGGQDNSFPRRKRKPISKVAEKFSTMLPEKGLLQSFLTLAAFRNQLENIKKIIDACPTHKESDFGFGNGLDVRIFKAFQGILMYKIENQ